MLPIPIAAYPLIGAGTGFLMAVSDKIFKGNKLDFTHSISGGAILGAAYAALTLVSITYGALAGAVACIACTAVAVTARGMLTKEIKEINGIAIYLLMGSFVGGGIAYYGLPIIAGISLGLILAPAVAHFKQEDNNRVRG